MASRTLPPLPEWVTEVRPHQQVAVDEIVEGFQAGVPVQILDAPTGSGKTLIAELVRRKLVELGLAPKTLYVCSDKALMDQFGNDFPYAKLLKGRGNYPTQNNPLKTADDCTSTGPGSMCWYCDNMGRCPYQIAKEAALVAPLAVTNTSFLLTEANHVGRFSKQPLIVADEADTLEGMLMGFVEYTISGKRLRQFGMQQPGKGIHKQTLVAWLRELSVKIGQEMHKTVVANKDAPEAVVKIVKRMAQLQEDTVRVANELQREIDKGHQVEESGRWLRVYDRREGDGLVLKPVMVDGYGTRQLWRHGRRWLLMSATIISSHEMMDSLGLPLDYNTVMVPSTFPKENRPIIMAPIANMVYKEMDTAIPKMVTAIRAVLNKHPGERILVHTVSYKLAEQLCNAIRQGHQGDRGGLGRTVLTYQTGGAKDRILQQYLDTPGAVMFAPSMGRGVDLPDDACRVQVIAKVPFLSLGDTQVSRRMRLPGGEMWYAVQAIRDIVQMTGRGVRHKDDKCVTYVFDGQFASNLWRKHRRLFPVWWQEAVVTNMNIREFMS